MVHGMVPAGGYTAACGGTTTNWSVLVPAIKYHHQQEVPPAGTSTIPSYQQVPGTSSTYYVAQ